MSVSDIPQKHVVEAQTRPSRWEEGPIPLVADLGKGTRRRREQVRNQEQIADVRQIESVLIESHDAAVDIIGSEPEKQTIQQWDSTGRRLSMDFVSALYNFYKFAYRDSGK